jgi:hypothetical protein
MQCNIDQRGRVARLLAGFALFFAGTILFVTGQPGVTLGWRIFQAVFTFLGVFMMYEGIMGWCALRALIARKQK